MLLYATLLKFGLAEGVYDERTDDGLGLTGCIILNSVKCLPPQNKPLPEEVATCRRLLRGARWRCCPTSGAGRARPDRARQCGADGGRQALGLSRSPISPSIALPDGRMLIDSYHCSRYNQNTGRLNAAMFEAVFARALAVKKGSHFSESWNP